MNKTVAIVDPDEITFDGGLERDHSMESLQSIPFLTSNYTKLALNGSAFSYYAMLFLISEKRMVMDYVHEEYSNNGTGKPFYNGGIFDLLSKVYSEEGILGLLGKKEWLPSVFQIGASFIYGLTVREHIFQPLTSSNSLAIRLGSSIVDNMLSSAVTHPIIVASLARHKRFDDMKKQRGFVETAVQIYSENGVKGLYRGYGWAMLQQAGTQVYKFGLSVAIRSVIESVIGNDYYFLDDETVDSLETIEELSTSVIFDATTSPFTLSLSRYIGDQGRTYSSYPDCVKKMYQQEGLKGFYKGSWLGCFL